MSGHPPDFDCIDQYLHDRESSSRVDESPERGSCLHPAQIALLVISLVLAFLASMANAQSKQTVPIVASFESSLQDTEFSVRASYKPVDFKMDFSQSYALSPGLLSPHDVFSNDEYAMSEA